MEDLLLEEEKLVERLEKNRKWMRKHQNDKVIMDKCLGIYFYLMGELAHIQKQMKNMKTN